MKQVNNYFKVYNRSSKRSVVITFNDRDSYDRLLAYNEARSSMVWKDDALSLFRDFGASLPGVGLVGHEN